MNQIKSNKFMVQKGVHRVIVEVRGDVVTQEVRNKAYEAAHKQVSSFDGWDKYRKNRATFIAEQEREEAAFNMHMIKSGKFGQLSEVEGIYEFESD